jgi:transposase-like protein
LFFKKEFTMKRRTWTPQQKTKIVLEGLAGRPLAEICNQYQISQAQYYQWREHFLGNAARAFEGKDIEKRERRWKAENQKLKQMVADLSLELKKNEDLGW